MTVCQRIYDDIGALIENLIDAIDDIPAAKLNTAHQSALERAETDLRKAVSELQRLRSTFE